MHLQPYCHLFLSILYVSDSFLILISVVSTSILFIFAQKSYLFLLYSTHISIFYNLNAICFFS
jgi:hypothetical protein